MQPEAVAYSCSCQLQELVLLQRSGSCEAVMVPAFYVLCCAQAVRCALILTDGLLSCGVAPFQRGCGMFFRGALLSLCMVLPCNVAV
jgi:hypothetical protein